MLAYQQQKSQNPSSLQSSEKQKMLHDSTTVNPPTCSKQQCNQIPTPKQNSFFFKYMHCNFEYPTGLDVHFMQIQRDTGPEVSPAKGPKQEGLLTLFLPHTATEQVFEMLWF